MAIINIVTPTLNRTKFSGGILCILEYASGLVSRGHTVNIIPFLPSQNPEWFAKDFGSLITVTKHEVKGSFFLACRRYLSSVFTMCKPDIKKRRLNLIRSLILSETWALSTLTKKGVIAEYLKQIIPDADITIATSFETALPVYLYGTGKKFYFMQHYEVLFKEEFEDPFLTEEEARLSYRLGLNLVANSSWLCNVINREVLGVDVELCPNAIDHEVFDGEPKVSGNNNLIKIISYGGRDAVWKGFREMAEAVSIARKERPNLEIQWLVYGDAVLPPDNSIAHYTPLGFLGSRQLAEAYRQADILLSASWYESFPLFPIEAMACGLPVITTQNGTEEYAIHGVTAEIVEEKNPQKIAVGLLKVIDNSDYRNDLAVNGNVMARKFTWDRSVIALEGILLGEQAPSPDRGVTSHVNVLNCSELRSEGRSTKNSGVHF